MLLMVLALVGGVGYALYRLNVKAGTETLRAYIYLQGHANGEHPDSLRVLTDTAPSRMGTTITVKAARFVDEFFAGKQLPLIGAAYLKGLNSNMPAWYRRGAVKAALEFQDPSHSAQTITNHDELHGIDEARYASYYLIFLKELKVLAGKGDTELHWVELADDKGQRRAFTDGVDALVLARWYHDHAVPPLPDAFSST